MAAGSRKAWTFIIGYKKASLQQNVGQIFMNICVVVVASNIVFVQEYVCCVSKVSIWHHVHFLEGQSGSLTLAVDVV